MNAVLLILRLVAGLLFARHGSQKLFGWFGGGGIRGTGAAFDSLGLRPGRAQAMAAGMNEVTGGLLLATGLLLPVAAMLVAATMAAAFIAVNSRKPWDNDWDLSALYVATAFAAAGLGAGKISLDHAFGIGWAGIGWAAAAVAIGALGGAGATFVGHRLAPPAPSDPRPDTALP
jgi:putative oxidoreductase